MLSLLRSSRDWVADRLGDAIARWPALEPTYASVGRVLWRTPGVGRVYTRSVEQMCDHLQGSGQQFRRVTIDGLTFTFDVSEFTMREYYFVGVLHEPSTTRYLLSTLKPGDVFVDIGANHGYYTVMAAMLTGDAGTVFAFEPNPAVIAQLTEHLALNGLDGRVEISGCALSDERRGGVEFFLPAEGTFNTGASSLIRDWDPRELFGSAPDSDRSAIDAKRRILVETRTFDDWRRERGVSRIDLMKIDVESAEAKVVAGMTQTLVDAPPARIVCETHWDGPAHEVLCQAGYEARALDWIVPNFGNILYTLIGRHPWH